VASLVRLLQAAKSTINPARLMRHVNRKTQRRGVIKESKDECTGCS
jgi:hypothetical protein